MNISGVVLTHNNEDSIKKCLSSLSFCDEIIIIDDFSSDKTISIVKKLGGKVFQRKLALNWADQRNFALTCAKGEWVLFVDSDEVVSSELASEIMLKLAKAPRSLKGFTFKRYDLLWGREIRHGEIGSVKLLRLGRNGVGVWTRAVHEYWDIKGEVEEFANPLFHFPHQTLSKFVADIHIFSLLHSKALYEEGKRSTLIKIIFWPTMKFIHNFIFRGGFLDGMQGFIVAFLMSFHSFLAWGNLWLIQTLRVNRIKM